MLKEAKEAVTSNLTPVTKTKVEDITPQDLFHCLIRDLANDTSVSQISYYKEADKSPSFDMNVNGDLVSLFLVKDEKEFMSILGFDREESFYE